MKIFMFIFLQMSSIAFGWTPQDIRLYKHRHFIELAHLLVEQKKSVMAKLILEQDRDLKGCKKIHGGLGGLDSLFQCVRFLNREVELKIETLNTAVLRSDINFLCGKLISEPHKLNRIIEAKIFEEKSWPECNELAWQQVYLTIYANFDADPVAALGLLRRSETSLGSHSRWRRKSLTLFNSNPNNN